MGLSLAYGLVMVYLSLPYLETRAATSPGSSPAGSSQTVSSRLPTAERCIGIASVHLFQPRNTVR